MTGAKQVHVDIYCSAVCTDAPETAKRISFSHMVTGSSAMQSNGPQPSRDSKTVKGPIMLDYTSAGCGETLRSLI